MKTYKIYCYLYFDESIEESNSSHQTLTKRYGDRSEQESNHGCWLGHICEMDLEKISKYCWSREDVDLFVEENPECKSHIFTIWRENRNFGERNWEKYCPLQENRDTKIHQIING